MFLTTANNDHLVKSTKNLKVWGNKNLTHQVVVPVA